MSARYPAIADHGIIGDLETAALVALDGTIDFLCLPSFDSPSVFLALLDAEHGGRFVVEAEIADARRDQRYLRDTNVLVTRTIGAAAEVSLYDFMPVPRRPSPGRIVRLVRVTRGRTRIRCTCAPRFDYARDSHTATIAGNAATFVSAGGARLRLTTSAPLTTDGRDVAAEVELAAGEEVAFVLELLGERAEVRAPPGSDAGRSLRQTVVFWRRWIAKSLRGVSGVESFGDRPSLSSCCRAGARARSAAGTDIQGCQSGSVGRATGTFVFHGFADTSRVHCLRVGLRRGGEAAMRSARASRSGWQSDARRRSRQASCRVYTIDGGREITEQTLDHLEGHAGSRPVHMGNIGLRSAAARHLW